MNLNFSEVLSSHSHLASKGFETILQGLSLSNNNFLHDLKVEKHWHINLTEVLSSN